MEKFQRKLRDVIGRLFRLWKGLEDVKQRGPEKTVSIPIEKYIKLVEQSILLLG